MEICYEQGKDSTVHQNLEFQGGQAFPYCQGFQGGQMDQVTQAVQDRQDQSLQMPLGYQVLLLVQEVHADQGHL